MRVGSFLLYVLLFILSNSCYEPEGENPVIVNPVDASNVIIDLEAVPDTVYIYKNTKFGFVYEGKPTMLSFELYIDNNRVYSSGEYFYKEFYFDAVKAGTGTHSAELRITARSNSGSLADKLDAERVVMGKKFTFIVDVDQPPSLQVNLDVSNGSMIVSWPSYSKWKFKGYRIIKKCRSSNGYMENCKYIEIADSTATQWEDKEYIGGDVEYQVDLITLAGSTWGQPKYYHHELTTDIQVLPGRKLNLRWSKSPFYKNINAITIYQNGVSVKSFTDFADTSLVASENYNFGDEYKKAFEIFLEGKEPGIKVRQSVAFAHGKLIDSNNWGFAVRMGLYNKTLDRYYIQHTSSFNHYLTIFDKDFNVLNQKQYGMERLTLSENGNWMYAYFYDAASPAKVKAYVHAINPNTLDTTRAFSITKTFGLPNVLRSKIEVSNTNLLAYHYTNGHAVSKMPAGNVLKWRTVAYSGVAISADGKYYHDYNEVYSINNDQLTLVGTIAPETDPDFTCFTNGPVQELLIMKNGKIRLIKIPELTERIIDIGPTGSESDVSYDPQSQWLLFNTSTGEYKSIMVNIITGEHFVVPTVNAEWNGMILVNSKLISQSGYIADINYVRSLLP